MKTVKPILFPISSVEELDSWYLNVANENPIMGLMINNMATHPDIEYFVKTSESQLLEDEYLNEEGIDSIDCVQEWSTFEPNQKLVACCISCGLMTSDASISAWQTFVDGSNMVSQFTFMPRYVLQEYLGLTDKQVQGVNHNTLVNWCLKKEKGENYLGDFRCGAGRL